MKQKLFYGTLICVAIITGVFYACKKAGPGELSASPGIGVGSGNSSRTAGTKEYYSKNNEGVVFKMTVTTSADGIISVDRGIYETVRPDTFKTRTFAGEGVTFMGYHLDVAKAKHFNLDTTSMFADTLYVQIPEGKTHHYVPFDPSASPHSRQYGGSKFYCQCGCNDCATYGDWACMKNGDASSNICVGICEDCKAIADCGFPSLRNVPSIGGLIIIDASNINVIH